MNRIADDSGPLLSHVEMLYRPDERGLAIDFVEALGCSVSGTGFKGDGADTFLAVHRNPDDKDPEKNAFYMSQVRPEQFLVEETPEQLSHAAGVFSASLADCRKAARSKPFGIPHFALRFAPDDEDAATGNLIQGFLHQDVVVSGSFLLGQVIELQAQP